MTVFEYLDISVCNCGYCDRGGPNKDGNLMVLAINKMMSIIDEDEITDLYKFESFAKSKCDEFEDYYNVWLFGDPANFFKLMEEALKEKVIG